MVPTVPVLVSDEEGVNLMTLSEALADAARVTVIEYVCVVVPSWAVTTVVMIVWPTAKAILPDVAPDITAAPLTLTVAVGSCAVGVIVTDVVELAAVVV